ncbi:recombination protein RecR [candidate division WWE3 bacterium]|nr:recombination protein RecR [candidate division WWE3 bacterium]
MKVARPIARVIEALQSLPGIGPRSAERLAYHLWRLPEDQVQQIADDIKGLKTMTVSCRECYNISESELCWICEDTGRNPSLVMVVEEPLDVSAMERTGKFDGLYHVLGGVLDPIRGIGPDELRTYELMDRIQLRLEKGSESIEIVLATNPSTEGETTAIYLRKMIVERFPGQPIKVTRIARGLPVGSDLEYADPMTLSRSLEGRIEY